MKTENRMIKKKKKNPTLSAIPTLHSENNRFSLCPEADKLAKYPKEVNA